MKTNQKKVKKRKKIMETKEMCKREDKINKTVLYYKTLAFGNMLH
jgi:hypothetical protein